MESEFVFKMTEEAQTDLDGIVAYIAVELSNPTAAANFVTEFEKSVERICLFPKNGTPINNEFLQMSDIRKVRWASMLFTICRALMNVP